MRPQFCAPKYETYKLVSAVADIRMTFGQWLSPWAFFWVTIRLSRYRIQSISSVLSCISSIIMCVYFSSDLRYSKIDSVKYYQGSFRCIHTMYVKYIILVESRISTWTKVHTYEWKIIDWTSTFVVTYLRQQSPVKLLSRPT